jgi:hypothetical protein
VGENRPWVDTSWLFEAAVALVFRWFGERGLGMLKLASTLCLIGLLAWNFSQQARNRFSGTAIAALTAAGILSRLSLEPALWGVTLLAAALPLSAARRQWWLLLLLAVYANVHSSHLAALLLVLAAGPAGARRWLPALSVFCTPYYGRQALAALRELAAAIQLEMFTAASPGTIYHYDFVILLLQLTLLLILLQRAALPRPALLVLPGAALLGAASLSFTPYALLLSGYAAAASYRLADPLAPLAVGVEKLQEGCSRLPALGTLWLAGCLLFVNAVNFYRLPFVTAPLPAAAVDELLDRNLPPPWIHPSAVGGYLSYRLSSADGVPRARATLDERAGLFNLPAAKRGRSFYQALPRETENLGSLGASAILCRTADPIRAVLERDSGWNLIFADRSWAVFARPTR